MSSDEGWEELCVAWGPDQLVPIEPERLTDAPVTERTREFLVRVGFPRECPLLVSFYRDERLLQPIWLRDIRYLLVGDDDGTLLALRAGTDELWSVTESEDEPRFVNSHLWEFVLLLGLYEPRAYPGFRQRVATCDEKALGHDDCWWSLIVEQMSYGLAP
ncbi:SUKH-4 family immunity protein [Nocardia sp. NBC_00881]|uniref:SUKH-4 family immunity protein n=1 Tax=Nocardia sp. NBC_00881 TaxID=2975995 RepID=UPI00386FF8CD|nr:SUKH-4 family immunity protein [Nocardia sp. NBC_00881]